MPIPKFLKPLLIRRPRLVKASFALLGGVLMGLTPAPVEAWFLAWVALVPLWMLVGKATTEKYPYRSAVLYAAAWGCGYHGLALVWITGVHPMTWMGVPWLASLAIALFCWVFITFWGVVMVSVWSVGMVFCQRRTRVGVRIVLGIALWCILETLWSASPLWWTTLAYTQSPHNLPILQLLQLSGTSTVTAAIIAVNALLAESLWHASLRRSGGVQIKGTIGVAFGLLLGLHLLGGGLYLRPLVEDSTQAMRVGIIQGNIPNTIKLYPEGWRRAIAGYTEGYNTLARAGVDAVLTPETALPFYWQDQVRNRSSFYSAILEQGVPVWVGAFGKAGDRYTNSLFSVTGNGETIGRFDKVKLVPLGEYIPLEGILGGVINRLSPLEARLAAGKPTQVLETPFGRAIAGICYESAFPEHFRRQAAQGGEFILSASNDAHYSASMPAQHHAQDIMRAIESDRWAVRATNTGYSAFVDPRGNTMWISSINTYALHAQTIYKRQTHTLYVRWGDWLTWVLSGLGISGWLFASKRG